MNRLISLLMLGCGLLFGFALAAQTDAVRYVIPALLALMALAWWREGK